MSVDEETRELPAVEAVDKDVEPSADLGPWGAEAVRLGVDAEPPRHRPSIRNDGSRPIQRRWATAGTFGLAATLTTALVVTTLPSPPDDKATPPTPSDERGVALAPSIARPKSSPRETERDRLKATRTRAKTREHTAPTSTAATSDALTSPTYPPTPAPAPSEPSPSGQSPPASGVAVAEEFGFER